jgi:hypothetical protein
MKGMVRRSKIFAVICILALCAACTTLSTLMYNSSYVGEWSGAGRDGHQYNGSIMENGKAIFTDVKKGNTEIFDWEVAQNNEINLYTQAKDGSKNIFLKGFLTEQNQKLTLYTSSESRKDILTFTRK